MELGGGGCFGYAILGALVLTLCVGLLNECDGTNDRWSQGPIEEWHRGVPEPPATGGTPS